MVQADNVDVYVVRQRNQKHRLTEHPVPFESPVNRGNPYERYIEAEDYDRFALVVHVGDDFDLKGASHLKITWTIDTEVAIATLPEASARGKHVFDSSQREIDGEWFECGFLFNRLKMDDDMHHDASDVELAFGWHGKVEATIERVVPQEKAGKKEPEPWTGFQAPDTAISSHDVVKKNNRVSHSVSHRVLRPGRQPMAYRPEDWRVLRGKKIPTMTIRYRSAFALEQLKIIAPEVVDIADEDAQAPALEEDLVITKVSRKRNAEEAGLAEETPTIKVEKVAEETVRSQVSPKTADDRTRDTPLAPASIAASYARPASVRGDANDVPYFDDEPAEVKVERLERQLAWMREIHILEGQLAAARASVHSATAREERERRDAMIKRLTGHADFD